MRVCNIQYFPLLISDLFIYQLLMLILIFIDVLRSFEALPIYHISLRNILWCINPCHFNQSTVIDVEFDVYTNLNSFCNLYNFLKYLCMIIIYSPNFHFNFSFVHTFYIVLYHVTEPWGRPAYIFCFYRILELELFYVIYHCICIFISWFQATLYKDSQ